MKHMYKLEGGQRQEQLSQPVQLKLQKFQLVFLLAAIHRPHGPHKWGSFVSQPLRRHVSQEGHHQAVAKQTDRDSKPNMSSMSCALEQVSSLSASTFCL